MNKFRKILLITVFASVFLTVCAAADDTVKINYLKDNVAGYDKQQVTVEGEAIGVALQRDEYTCVVINDGTNIITIWLPSEDAEKVTTFGDYNHVGDTIRIMGIFSRDCKEHRGDADIHAGNIEIVSQGYVLKEGIRHSKVVTAAVLFGVVIISTGIYLIVTRPKKQ